MKVAKVFCGEAGALTPTLSRERESESCTLSPGAGGEGWGEGGAAAPGY
jgi:hypothetical protein